MSEKILSIYNIHSHLVVRGGDKVPAGAVLLVAPVDAVRAQVADLGPRDALVHLLAAEVARAAVRLEMRRQMVGKPKMMKLSGLLQGSSEILLKQVQRTL